MFRFTLIFIVRITRPDGDSNSMSRAENRSNVYDRHYFFSSHLISHRLGPTRPGRTRVYVFIRYARTELHGGALTFVAQVDGDVLPEIKPVHDGPEQIGDHAGALDPDAQVVVARLYVVDLCVFPDHVQRLVEHDVQQHHRRGRDYFKHQFHHRSELKRHVTSVLDQVSRQ